MEKLFYVFFITLFFSCSDKDNGVLPSVDTEEGDLENIIPLKLGVKEARSDIFEGVEFNLFPDKYFGVLSLMDIYDSITWNVLNIDGSMKILEQGTRYATSYRYWSHHFYLPGEYKTYLLGYKDNKMIYCSDTVKVEITNEKDFLCYNWKDIKGSIGHATSYLDFLKEYEFVTYEGMFQNVPFVNVLLYDKEKKDKLGFLEKSKNILIDYINTLYSTSPVYTDKDDIFLEKYNELFTYKAKNTVPCCVWITSKSKIVLVKNEYYKEYQLYAEPNVISDNVE